MMRRNPLERGSLKINLLIPPASVFFIIFSVFIFFFIFHNFHEKTAEFDEFKKNTAALIAMTNRANLRNVDRPAMGENCESFLMYKEIVGIEIIDQNNKSIKKVMRRAKGAVTSVRRDVMHGGKPIGYVVIDFTDYYIQEDIRFMAVVFLVAGVVFIAIMTVIFVGFTAFLTDPITELAAQAVRVAAGDAGAAVSLKHARSREISRLAEAVAKMTSELGKRAEDFRRANAVLSEIIQKAGGIIVNVNLGAKEIESSAEKQTAAMNDFASGIAEVSATIEELSITAAQITSNVGELVLESEEAVKRLRANEGRLRDTISRLEGAADASRRNARAVAELGKRSVFIGEMAGLIKEVANKTNILSINASIEAARSGGAGTGFAVVAAEIRELSKETLASAKNAEKAAHEIEDFINSIVLTSEAESARVAESGAAVKAVHDDLGEVAERIGHNYSFTQKIDVSIKQQKNGSAQAAETMRRMADISRQSAGHARETLQVVVALAALAEELDATIAAAGRADDAAAV